MSTTSMTSTRIVGHRGAADHVAENTLASFERAIADGAGLLECDVHLSADGHVIVMHDETIDRMADADSPLTTGAIAELTLDQLRTVRIGGGHPVPTLPELVEASTVPLFIEVKAEPAAIAVARILTELPAGHPVKDSTVISFHPAALAVIREQVPGVPVSLLVERLDEQALAAAREIDADAIGPWIGALSLAGADLAREAGLGINPWTINEPEQLAVALACGVDSITTDDPAWVREELAGR